MPLRCTVVVGWSSAWFGYRTGGLVGRVGLVKTSVIIFKFYFFSSISIVYYTLPSIEQSFHVSSPEA